MIKFISEKEANKWEESGELEMSSGM